MTLKMVKVLKRTGRGFSRACWTRHLSFAGMGKCGVVLLGRGVVPDDPSVQGEVKDCKKCLGLARSK
jgi:hypothetical protein